MSACTATIAQAGDGLVPLLTQRLGEDAVRLAKPEEGTLAHELGEYHVHCHFGRSPEHVIGVFVRPQINGSPYYEAKMAPVPLDAIKGAADEQTIRLLLGETIYPQTQGELVDLLESVRSALT